MNASFAAAYIGELSSCRCACATHSYKGAAACMLLLAVTAASAITTAALHSLSLQLTYAHSKKEEACAVSHAVSTVYYTDT
jgi:hypothetical protein